MSLVDRLRDAQDEPARRRGSEVVGPSLLSVAQLQAMQRALEHEGFVDDDEPATDEPATDELVADEPELSLWDVLAQPVDLVEPLPLWSPPAAEPAAVSCPRCGDTARVERVDLTANAGWFHCGSCGRRWGGSIEVAGRGPTTPTTSMEHQRQL